MSLLGTESLNTSLYKHTSRVHTSLALAASSSAPTPHRRKGKKRKWKFGPNAGVRASHVEYALFPYAYKNPFISASGKNTLFSIE